MEKAELITQLISGISSYMLQKNPMRLVLSLHQEEDGLHLSVMNDAPHTDAERKQMEKDLNSHKRPELASYYGAMTGHDLLGASSLNLLGWQVKHTDVTKIDNNGIKIDFWLGGERFDSRNFSIPEE